MKPLKYSAVFKKVADGSRLLVAHESLQGYCVMAKLDGAEFGLEYMGPNNRTFLIDAKKDRKWSVRDEMDVVDFMAAKTAAFNIPSGEDGIKRIDIKALKDAADYAFMPVKPGEPNLTLSVGWLIDGLFYGTDGHRIHRAKAPLSEKPGTLYGIPPFMLNAFLGACLSSKSDMWAGVMYEDGKLKLTGGTQNLNVWLTIDAPEDLQAPQRITDLFEHADKHFDVMLDVGALVVESEAGVLSKSLDTAPRIGEDGGAVGFKITKGKIEHAVSRDAKTDPSLPPIGSVTVINGQDFDSQGEYLPIYFGHKYLKEALSFPGKAVVLFQHRNYAWMGDGAYTAILMPQVS